MNHQPLRLTVKAGPRQGETIDSQPGSEIRIGRIARANTFVIKDAAISSNHLVIKFDSGKWNIQDLGSSNGTFVNSVEICPLHNFNLNDGDVVKIGEVTSISVDISCSDAVEPQLRRSTRRRAPVLTAQVDAVPSISRSRVRRPVTKATKSKNRESELKDPPVAAPVQRGRRRKCAVSTVDDETPAVVQNIEDIDTIGKRRSTRRNQRVKTPAEIPEVVVEEDIDLDSTRENGITGRGDRLKVPPNFPLFDEANHTGASNVEIGRVSEDIAFPSVMEVNDASEGVGAVDLERMTVGQWFEYLKVHIPKEIHEETEKIIEAMKHKAQKCAAYVAECRSVKEKLVQNED